jgi:hypothetical protein
MKTYEDVLAYMREAQETVDRLADEIKGMMQDWRMDRRLGVHHEKLAEQESAIREKQERFIEIADGLNRRADELIAGLCKQGSKFRRESPRSDQRDPNHSGDPEDAR